MPPMAMVHETDPKDVLLNKLKPFLDRAKCMNNQVLVAIYDRPAQTKAGIHLPDKYRDEEQFQGKACLIVMMGETAFAPDPEKGWFSNVRPVLYDWVAIRPSDGFPMALGSVKCRLVTDTAVRMVIDQPDLIW